MMCACIKLVQQPKSNIRDYKGAGYRLSENNDEIESCYPTSITSKNNADNGRKINKCKSGKI
jgi:hypothetical protein